MDTKLPSTNTLSIISAILGLLILFSCCAGAIPIPFTGILCFPLAFLLSVLSPLFGWISLRQIRASGDEGTHFAWTGIILGGIVLILSISVILLIVGLFLFAPNSLPGPLHNMNLF